LSLQPLTEVTESKRPRPDDTDLCHGEAPASHSPSLPAIPAVLSETVLPPTAVAAAVPAALPSPAPSVGTPQQNGAPSVSAPVPTASAPSPAISATTPIVSVPPSAIQVTASAPTTSSLHPVPSAEDSSNSSDSGDDEADEAARTARLLAAHQRLRAKLQRQLEALELQSAQQQADGTGAGMNESDEEEEEEDEDEDDEDDVEVKGEEESEVPGGEQQKPIPSENAPLAANALALPISGAAPSTSPTEAAFPAVAPASINAVTQDVPPAAALAAGPGAPSTNAPPSQEQPQTAEVASARGDGDRKVRKRKKKKKASGATADGAPAGDEGDEADEDEIDVIASKNEIRVGRTRPACVRGGRGGEGEEDTQAHSSAHSLLQCVVPRLPHSQWCLTLLRPSPHEQQVAVEPVDIVLEPSHPIVLVGSIQSIVDTIVVIKAARGQCVPAFPPSCVKNRRAALTAGPCSRWHCGCAEAKPVDLDSLLCLADRTVMGKVVRHRECARSPSYRG